MINHTEYTEYGTVAYGADYASIRANDSQLRAWAERPDAVWPCSHLSRLEGLFVAFDANGLVDIEATGLDFDEWEDAGVSSDELNAWSSDVLRGVLPADHLTRFVTVDQFA
jgi:hypothetical protein